MTFREAKSGSGMGKEERQSRGSSTQREKSMKFRKCGKDVSPFVLARTKLAKKSPAPVVKEKQ